MVIGQEELLVHIFWTGLFLSIPVFWKWKVQDYSCHFAKQCWGLGFKRATCTAWLRCDRVNSFSVFPSKPYLFHLNQRGSTFFMLVETKPQQCHLNLLSSSYGKNWVRRGLLLKQPMENPSSQNRRLPQIPLYKSPALPCPTLHDPG